MSNIVKIARTETGVVKKRRQYPKPVIALLRLTECFVKNAEGYNDASNVGFRDCYIVTLDNVTTVNIKDVDAYLSRFHASVMKITLDTLSDERVIKSVDKNMLILAQSVLEKASTATSYIFVNQVTCNQFIAWAGAHLVAADLYVDSIKVRQLTAAEKEERQSLIKAQLEENQENCAA
tara:strand:- start:47466 stop:47999 length:534 start_codon:yes stop_codon:yes gene_type:complete